MRIRTENQHGEHVLDFWRCPMIPLRDATAETGTPTRSTTSRRARPGAGRRRARRLGAGPLPRARPGRARRGPRGRVTLRGRGPRDGHAATGARAAHAERRLRAHRRGRSAHGRRLVYGGHTIAIAAAHTTRALPDLVTIVAWHGCDHTGPVFDGDILSTEIASRERDRWRAAAPSSTSRSGARRPRREGEPPGRPGLALHRPDGLEPWRGARETGTLTACG